MSHTNSTTNYNLPQFVGSDTPAWLTDVNQAFETIDIKIKTNENGISETNSRIQNVDEKTNNNTSSISTLSSQVNVINGLATEASNQSTANTNEINKIKSDTATSEWIDITLLPGFTFPGNETSIISGNRFRSINGGKDIEFEINVGGTFTNGQGVKISNTIPAFMPEGKFERFVITGNGHILGTCEINNAEVQNKGIYIRALTGNAIYFAGSAILSVE